VTNAQLQKALKRWQTILGLDSWHITASFVKPWKLDDDCTARSEIDPFHQKARFEIVEPALQNKDAVEYEKPLHLLIHELLHVRLFPDGVKEGTAENLALEVGINALAKMLMEYEGE